MALTLRLPSTRVEPFYGFVESTGDALRLVQAARQGIVPRITRRLNDLERRAMIRSGAIFIFSDEESGIKRWTEGLSWSASRIVGNFLVYREVCDRSNARTPLEGRRAAKRRVNINDLSPAEIAEQKLAKSLVGCLSDGTGRFKAKGLVKKTITINIDGSDHHLIAYYSQEDVRLGKLLPLSSRPDIMALDIPPELLESTKFRVPPIMYDGADGRPRYVCDADDGDLPRQTSIAFPPIPQAPLPRPIITHYLPQSHSSMIYADVMSTVPAVETLVSCPSQTQISPSTCSTTSSSYFDNDLAWQNVNTTIGYLPHPACQNYQLGNVIQTSQAISGPASHGVLLEEDAAVTIHHPSVLFPACSAEHEVNGIGMETAAFSYAAPSQNSDSSTASYYGQSEINLAAWTAPHFLQHSPTTYSSLPTTPTQPRHAHRSTSMPSLLDTKFSDCRLL